ncbi:MAG: TIGR01458 family HAD-type hydrolase [Methanoregula sp.]|jgi:HAD superfamily hydrolase (TIGR01458 family)
MMDIKGLLIDLDGVLYVGDTAISGAQDTIEFLKEQKIPFRFVSNTTRKCRETIARHIYGMGIGIPVEYIFTPPLAAVAYMKKSGKNRVYLLTTGDVHKDFEPACVCNCSCDVDYVIIGDAGDKLTYDSLNRAFRHINGGAELIALEKDRYWMAPDGLSLSAGPFVEALEFATGKTPVVMGKPSLTFFELALNDMGLTPPEAAMIGDDIVTDIGGAQNAGMKGILVRTGKFSEERMKGTEIKPTYIINSIADLKNIIRLGTPP